MQILIKRLQRVRRLDGIIIATTLNAVDEPIAQLAAHLGIPPHRGSENDVLARVCGALQATQADVCVEITADCPLTDPAIVQEAIEAYLATRSIHPYVSNSDPHRSVPAGLDVQVFKANALYQLNDETQDPLDREHVSYGFYRPESGTRFKPRFITHDRARGTEDLLVTLDYREDYELIRALHEDLSGERQEYGVEEIASWIRAHPDLHNACRRVRERTTWSPIAGHS